MEEVAQNAEGGKAACDAQAPAQESALMALCKAWMRSGPTDRALFLRVDPVVEMLALVFHREHAWGPRPAAQDPVPN